MHLIVIAIVVFSFLAELFFLTSTTMIITFFFNTLLDTVFDLDFDYYFDCDLEYDEYDTSNSNSEIYGIYLPYDCYDDYRYLP